MTTHRGPMAAGRKGRGETINRERWPASGAWRDWLVYCDRTHRANGMPSQRRLAEAMHLRQPGRVGEILRGQAWPADDAQARLLLEALGAVGAEVDRGLRLYVAARTERDSAPGPESPWWRHSGYIEQVRDIAPLDLLDRQAELDELAAWCAHGDEPYVWWQAGAWAGKSALMSWLVLHPPPGVWVVSFFVTARYAGQADSTAFTDGLVDQLSAITGDQVRPAASAAERDRLRRRLLNEAVDRAARAGRTLVLLVDGLDEDCGALPGSGLPSIAACLPKRPPDGLRILVAGRPDPPIPADVDPDHPLRTCRVRQLRPSPYAERVTGLAQRELDEVLATDPRRHGGLGFEVLGLVTAAGGGLSPRDLRQLTGKPAYEIDLLLRGVFGRTIAGRADPHTTERVFLFTHETLRVQAIERLGPETLAGFQDRIRDWADGYRRRGWPPDTPQYLIRGYPRMLAEAADLPRLVAVVADPARHERMLAATGGDEAALTDIATAFTLLRARPDLGVALRLAWQRDRLTERNRYIPAALPALWVRLGQPVRAEGLARSVTDRPEREKALLGVVEAMAAEGDHDGAETVARSFAGWGPETRALIRVAVSIAESGDFDRAERTGLSASPAEIYEFDQRGGLACSRSRPDLEVQLLAELAKVAVRAGDLDRMTAMIEKIEAMAGSDADRGWRSNSLAEVVVAMAAEGYHDQARRVERSLRLDAYDRTEVLAEWAEATAAAGAHRRAGEIIDQAEEFARSITVADHRAAALAQVVGLVAGAGDLDRAERIAGSITDAGHRERALARVAVARAAVVARDGDYDRAEAIARSATDPETRAEILAGVVAAMVSGGAYERAEAVARSMLGSRLLVELVVALVGNDDYDRARRITASISDPESVATAMIALAAGADHRRAVELLDEAEVLARATPYPSTRATALTILAEKAAGLGEHGRAVALAGEAERAAHNVNADFDRDRALSGLADVAARIGDYDRAETIACSIDIPGRRWHALTDLLLAIARSGDHDRAERVAHSISGPDSRLHALIGLARVMVGRPRAVVLLDQAEALIESIANPEEQVRLCIELAKAVAGTGDHGRAVACAERAGRIAHRRCSEFYQLWAEISVAKAVAGTGDYDRAETLVRAITVGLVVPEGLRDVAIAAAHAGDHDRALTVARSITDAGWRRRVLAELTALLADAGKQDRATAVAAEAAELAWAGADQADLMGCVVDAFVAVGDHDQAETAARSVPGTESRIRVLTDLARALDAAGDRARASSVIAQVESEIRSLREPGDQAPALVALSWAAPPSQAPALIAQALAIGPWTESLPAIARADPRVIADFLDQHLDSFTSPS